MTDKELVTLINVISKIKLTADKDFNGHIYENILTIFNRLNTREKRVLLRGLINICFIVEDKVLVNSNELLEVKDTLLATTAAIENTEQSNKIELARELVRLKTLLIKSTLVVIGTLIMVLLMFSFNITTNVSLITGFLEGLGKMFKVMFL